MDVEAAAKRWAETWSHSWRQGDVEAIASLYSDDAVYRALALSRTVDWPASAAT